MNAAITKPVLWRGKARSMKLSFRKYYLLYILVLHMVLAWLLFTELRQAKPLFAPKEVLSIALQLLIGLSVYIAIRIYRAFREPSEFIASGIEAIQDQDFTVKFVPTGNQEVDELIDVYNLMIDQLRLERTRQVEQQFFLEQLIEAAPIAILIFDFDGRIASINPRASQLLAMRTDDVKGKLPADLGHALLDQLTDLVDGKSRVLKPNGIDTYKVTRSTFMDRGFRRSFLMIEELTSEILTTEKKAYSKVIRMMAHEVNNSIGAVNSILDLSQTYVNEPDVQHALRVAIDRNDHLNRFMRRFADVVRLPAPQQRPADLGELLRNVVRLMQPLADGRGVSLTNETSEVVEWSIDAGQMEQVFINILKNAIEACAPGQRVEVLYRSRYVIIRDNGQPIPDEVAANLFNPFYSTKPGGQGIGLTIAREILLNHQFTLSFQTRSSGWTEFVVALDKETLAAVGAGY